MKIFQDSIAKINKEYPEVTLTQKQTILAREIADEIYKE